MYWRMLVGTLRGYTYYMTHFLWHLLQNTIGILCAGFFLCKSPTFLYQQRNKGKLDNREKRMKIKNHMGNIFNALDRGWIIKVVYLPHFQILCFKLNLLSIAVLKWDYMHSVCRFTLNYIQHNCIALIAIMHRQIEKQI